MAEVTQENSAPGRKIPTNKILWLFAIGQLGWAILAGVINNWLVYYYMPGDSLLAQGHMIFVTQGAIFFGLTLLGLIAACGRVFDAVTDPLIGSLSDRCKHKLGRRIPFMRYAAVPLGVVTVLVFVSPVNGESPINNLFLAVMVVLFYLCLTCYCTPYNALIPELGYNQKLRINVSTFISVTYFVGTALAYSVTAVAGIFEPSLGSVNAFRATIGILALIAIICMLVPTFGIKEHDFADTTPSESPAISSLVKTFKNKDFQVFVGSDILYWIALTMFQTGLAFYITELMGLDDAMALPFFILMTVVSLLFYAPVNILAKRLGKKKLIMFAFVFFGITFGLTSFAGIGLPGIVWGVIVSVLASIPMAVLGILPQAVVADIAESDAITTGEARQGMFYAARTFSFKLGQSVAMILFTSIALIGEGGMGYRLTAAVACVLCLLGSVVFSRYKEGRVMAIIDKKSENE